MDGCKKQIRENVIEHLHKLGYEVFNDQLICPENLDKDMVRDIYVARREERENAKKQFVNAKAHDLICYFANGSDICPEAITPKLEEIQAGTWQSDLFRLSTLLWSVPVSRGFGRRMRFLVWDNSRRCPGQAAQKAILLHGFRSDVALVAVELPATLAANPIYPRGRAVWLSFGNALLRAAATNLQIDTNELAVGMRPWRHPDGRLMGEVFLYDTLPNGAGYADEFVRNIEQILEVAHDICANCRNTDCETACYRCLLDYGNQRNHALLNRYIAIDLLDFIREGREPEISLARQERALGHLEHFALLGYDLSPAIIHNFGQNRQISRVLTTPEGSRISLWPIHTLRIPPEEYTTAARDMGTIPVYISEFDLTVRPFWVWNQILREDVGMLE